MPSSEFRRHKRVFPIASRTNGPTDRQTDKPFYQDARTHLKRQLVSCEEKVAYADQKKSFPTYNDRASNFWPKILKNVIFMLDPGPQDRCFGISSLI